jgi:transposase
MSNRRLEMHRLQELVRLHRMHVPVREVARLLGMSPNTERDYRTVLQSAGLLAGPALPLPELETLKAAVLEAKPPPRSLPAQQVSSLDGWRSRVEALMDKGLRPRAIFDRLRLEHAATFAGSYSAVKRLYRAIKRGRGVRAEDVAIPVETKPGEVAQVDFGYVGQLFDPTTQTLRKAWCFVMVLAHSRHMVARVVFDQKIETWLELHVQAFAELGGVIETVVPDNLKAAVVRAAFGLGDSVELNRSYQELARHYGFKIDPTPPYDARKKGKVESGVKYVKRNFFVGREGSDVEDVRRELARWVREIAGQREHGTTHRRPLATFEDVERAALRGLPPLAWEPVVWRKAQVHVDTHVCFDRRLYSVPWRLVGKTVWLRATRSTVVIYADDERVATHDRRGRGYRSTKEEHLPEHRRDLRHRSRDYWEQRAAVMGPEVARFIREVFESDDVLSQLRAVQAMVTHLETYPARRARAACVRASCYGNTTYRGLKTILKKALDLDPLPTVVAPAPALSSPRFARKMSELLALPQETGHEPN